MSLSQPQQLIQDSTNALRSYSEAAAQRAHKFQRAFIVYAGSLARLLQASDPGILAGSHEGSSVVSSRLRGGGGVVPRGIESVASASGSVASGTKGVSEQGAESRLGEMNEDDLFDGSSDGGFLGEEHGEEEEDAESLAMWHANRSSSALRKMSRVLGWQTNFEASPPTGVGQAMAQAAIAPSAFEGSLLPGMLEQFLLEQENDAQDLSDEEVGEGGRSSSKIKLSLSLYSLSYSFFECQFERQLANRARKALDQFQDGKLNFLEALEGSITVLQDAEEADAEPEAEPTSTQRSGLRVLKLFEVLKDLNFRPAQPKVLFQFFPVNGDSPDIFVELAMGMGKSKVLLPLIIALCQSSRLQLDPLVSSFGVFRAEQDTRVRPKPRGVGRSDWLFENTLRSPLISGAEKETAKKLSLVVVPHALYPTTHAELAETMSGFDQTPVLKLEYFGWK